MPREGAEEHLSFYVEKFRPDAVVLGPGLEEASVQGVPCSITRLKKRLRSQISSGWLVGWKRRAFPS